MQDVFNRNFTKNVLIMNGRKILKLTDGKVYFIDSLSFLPMPLTKLSKVFNFQNRAMKVYYPYTFNTEEKFNYQEASPSTEHFVITRMTLEDRKKFDQWFNSVRHLPYDFRPEMRKYCKNDGVILMIVVLNFQKHIIKMTSMNTYTKLYLGINVFGSFSR